MKELAYVVSTEGDYALVAVRKVSSCGEDCASCGLCKTDPKREVRVYNACHAKAGEPVFVVLETWKTLALAALTYVLPLFAFFLVYALSKNEIAAVLSLIVCFPVAAIAGNLLAKRRSFMSHTEQV